MSAGTSVYCRWVVVAPKQAISFFVCRGAFLVLFSLSRHICFEGQPGKEKVWQPLSTIDKKEIGMITHHHHSQVSLSFSSQDLLTVLGRQTEFFYTFRPKSSSFMCSHALQLNKKLKLSKSVKHSWFFLTHCCVCENCVYIFNLNCQDNVVAFINLRTPYSNSCVKVCKWEMAVGNCWL